MRGARAVCKSGVQGWCARVGVRGYHYTHRKDVRDIIVWCVHSTDHHITLRVPSCFLRQPTVINCHTVAFVFAAPAYTLVIFSATTVPHYRPIISSHSSHSSHSSPFAVINQDDSSNHSTLQKLPHYLQDASEAGIRRVGLPVTHTRPHRAEAS